MNPIIIINNKQKIDSDANKSFIRSSLASTINRSVDLPLIASILQVRTAHKRGKGTDLLQIEVVMLLG